MVCCSGECGWLRETRTHTIHWGMFIHWGNKLRVSPNAVRVEMLVPCVKHLRGAKIRWEEEYEKVKRGNSNYATFPLCELQVEFGNIVALNTLK